MTRCRRMLWIFVCKYCVLAEQTVAVHKTKLYRNVSKSSNMLCQSFAADATKELATL